MTHPATTDRESRQVLGAVCWLLRPRRILEIGTAFGIGTLALHAGAPEAIIHTVEKDHEMLLASRGRLKPYPEIHQYEADSATWAPPFAAFYDFVYVDGGEDRRAEDLRKFNRYTVAGGIMAIHDMKPANALYWKVLDVVAALKLPSYEIPTPGGLLLVRT